MGLSDEGGNESFLKILARWRLPFFLLLHNVYRAVTKTLLAGERRK